MYLDIQVTPPERTMVADGSHGISGIVELADGRILAGAKEPASGGMPSDGLFAPSQEPMLGELERGFVKQREVAAQHSIIDWQKTNQSARNAFRRLLGTSVTGSGPRLPYQLNLLSSDQVNAFAVEGGQIYVHSGMTSVLGDDEGMWAAVLSHEIAHCVAQHQYKAYTRLYELQRMKNYYAWRSAMGDQYAVWAQLGLKIGGDLLHGKLSRNEELEADRLGMAMMAEAGYHPDYIRTLFARMRHSLGDSGKVATFFSSGHPRWQTREEKVAQQFRTPLEAFKKKWADPAKSPGGMPPMAVELDGVKITSPKNARELGIAVPVEVRHAEGSDVRVEVRFLAKGRPVASPDPAFQLPDGSMGVAKAFRAGGDEVSESLTTSIAGAAFPPKQKNVTMVARLIVGGEVVAETDAMPVKLPK
jgi:hypothetical protein